MDKHYKKRLIITSLGFVVCVIGLTVCMILAEIIGNKDSSNNQPIVNNVKEEKQELVIDGMGNLYFIPISGHDDFSDNLSFYLSFNGITPIGAVT